jgi:hypothetical protein
MIFCLGLLNSAHQQRISVDQIYSVKRCVDLVSFTSTLKANSNTLKYVIESKTYYDTYYLPCKFAT